MSGEQLQQYTAATDSLLTAPAPRHWLLLRLFHWSWRLPPRVPDCQASYMMTRVL